jgi:5-methylcytosine-specific restriction endonuclease McrA
MNILNLPVVLVLNRNWQAINVRTPQQAFVQMASDTATGLAIEGDNMTPLPWAEWIQLPIREQDLAVQTPRGAVRVPTVVVLARFAKVPKRRPKFSLRALWARDESRCQYTGRVLKHGEGNIDHVVPRSRGGKTSWENCVLASRDVNSKKGDRLPEEVGLRLMRNPVAPRELPSTLFIRNIHAIPEWKHFLVESSRPERGKR